MFHSLTGPRLNYYYCNLPHPSGSNTSTYTANPVTVMCNDAERAVAQGLKEATSAAKMAGVHPPLDVVTGFERGCHLNGGSNVILLIGSKTVHAIAHPSVDDMFNWAEILEQHLIGECVCVCVSLFGLSPPPPFFRLFLLRLHTNFPLLSCFYLPVQLRLRWPFLVISRSGHRQVCHTNCEAFCTLLGVFPIVSPNDLEPN